MNFQFDNHVHNCNSVPVKPKYLLRGNKPKYLLRGNKPKYLQLQNCNYKILIITALENVSHAQSNFIN